MLNYQKALNASLITLLLSILVLKDYTFQHIHFVFASRTELSIIFRKSPKNFSIPIDTLKKFAVFDHFIKKSQDPNYEECFNANIKHESFKMCSDLVLPKEEFDEYEEFEEIFIDVLRSIKYLNPIDACSIYKLAQKTIPEDKKGIQFLLNLNKQKDNELFGLKYQFKILLIEIIKESQSLFLFPKTFTNFCISSHGIKSKSMVNIENTSNNTHISLGLDIIYKKHIVNNDFYRNLNNIKVDFMLIISSLFLLTNNMEKHPSYIITFKGEVKNKECFDKDVSVFRYYKTVNLYVAFIEKLVFENCEITDENISFLSLCFKLTNITFKFCYLRNKGLDYVLKVFNGKNILIEIEFIYPKFESGKKELPSYALRFKRFVYISRFLPHELNYQNYFIENCNKSSLNHLTLGITNDFKFKYQQFYKIFPSIVNLNLKFEITSAELQIFWIEQINLILKFKKIENLSIDVVSGIFLISKLALNSCKSLKSITLVGVIFDVLLNLNENTIEVYLENVYFYKQSEFKIVPEVIRTIDLKNFDSNGPFNEEFNSSDLFKNNIKTLTIDFDIWEIRQLLCLKPIPSCSHLKICNCGKIDIAQIIHVLDSFMLDNCKTLEMVNFEPYLNIAKIHFFMKIENLIIRSANKLPLRCDLLTIEGCIALNDLKRLEIYSKSTIKIFGKDQLELPKNLKILFIEGILANISDYDNIFKSIEHLENLNIVNLNIL